MSKNLPKKKNSTKIKNQTEKSLKTLIPKTNNQVLAVEKK
jgi:hypothetical protein